MGGIVSQLASQLTLEEKRELVRELRAAIAGELAARAEADPAACPRCGCPAFVRKGRGRDGGQRWLCRGCARTFSARSGGLLARSKLPASAWMAFAECMADALPLRETARRVGVSLYTAWFMRMRACEVMAARTPGCRPGRFHVDGLYVRESLSGNRRRSEAGMPRPAHRNGRDGRRGRRGRSGESFYVVCGVNELGDCFCDLGGRGAASSAALRAALAARVPEGCPVVTDGAYAYRSALEGWARHEPSGPRMADSLHSRLRAFLAPMRGVSTRRLQRYLDWFRYAEAFKRTDADRRELLFEHEAEGRYRKTRALTHAEPNPGWGWWAEGVSTVV